MSLNAAFLHDLEQCARRVYELHDDLAQRWARLSIDRVFDRDRRVVIGLTGQLLASIALIPWLGAGSVLAGLAVLYVGAIASAAWTVARTQRIGASERRASIDQAVRQAIATSPPLDAGSIAVLIRVGNLAAIPATPRSVAMLKAAIGEAAARPGLLGWPFLDDVAALADRLDSRAHLVLPGI